MDTKFTLSTKSELIDAIKIRAIKEKRNVNDIINELMEQYLKDKKEEEK